MNQDSSEPLSGLVSTVIPVFNRGGMLREAVGSVLAQTYRPIEIIIVDDGSTDDTTEVCQSLAEANPGVVLFVRRANGGAGAARETGRQHIRGEFVQYLDSDDLLWPRKFEVQVTALRNNPNAQVAYCFTRYYRMGETPDDRPWKGSGQSMASMFPSFLVDRWWDTPNPLYRRSVCDAAGPWTDLRFEEDWEYDCRIAALGATLVHCPEFLVDVRDHSGNRLCKGSPYDPQRNQYRARARELIYQHAIRGGIPADCPEMKHFARATFLLARQCGASGSVDASKRLFEIARQANFETRTWPMDFLIYRLATLVLGWHWVGRLACWSDRFRKK